MTESSRTVWADWVQRPPVCAICGQRVTLKQSHRQQWDELRRQGRVIHVKCDPKLDFDARVDYPERYSDGPY